MSLNTGCYDYLAPWNLSYRDSWSGIVGEEQSKLCLSLLLVIMPVPVIQEVQHILQQLLAALIVPLECFVHMTCACKRTWPNRSTTHSSLVRRRGASLRHVCLVCFPWYRSIID